MIGSRSGTAQQDGDSDENENVVEAAFGTIGGSEDNHVSGRWATIGGGRSNDASGRSATIPGGRDNTADYSLTAGRLATAHHDGAFVVGDSSVQGVTSGGEDEVRFQAGGGFVVETLPTGSGQNLQWDDGA